MIEKPTYDELEKRVKDLEKEVEFRKKAEEALALERSLLFSTLDSIEGGIYVSDMNTYEILYASQSTKETFQKEIIGGVCYRELQKLDSPCEFCTNEIIRKQAPVPHRWEIHNTVLNRDYAIVDRMIKWLDGRDVRFEIALDVTAKKQADEALRESEETFRLIAETAIEGIYKINSKGNFVYVNEACEKMLDYESGELTGKHYSIVIPEDGRIDAAKIIDTVVSGTSLRGGFTMINKHGRKFSAYFSMVRQFEQGDKAGVTGILHDITEQKEAEKLIRDLHYQLIKSQEKERQTISRELHDGVAQDLLAMKISCEMLLKNKLCNSEIRKSLSEILVKHSEILKAVRNLSYALRPPDLEKRGLVEAINQCCKEFSNESSVNVEFFSAGIDNLLLKFEANINIYRMVQEGLNNVKKHADASNVKIRLVSSFPNIILRIEDDGKGFDTEERLITAYKEKRMGIRSMKERVALLQGEMHIKSIPGKGTNVVFEIPYKDRESILA